MNVWKTGTSTKSINHYYYLLLLFVSELEILDFSNILKMNEAQRISFTPSAIIWRCHENTFQNGRHNVCELKRRNEILIRGNFLFAYVSFVFNILTGSLHTYIVIGIHVYSYFLSIRETFYLVICLLHME